jgi:hypothetical protein
VALDKPFSQIFFALYSMVIDPKSLTPSVVSGVQNKNTPITNTFAFNPFLFFSFFFSKCEAFYHHLVISSQ